jgi:hypothetical protein
VTPVRVILMPGFLLAPLPEQPLNMNPLDQLNSAVQRVRRVGEHSRGNQLRHLVGADSKIPAGFGQFHPGRFMIRG